ncbi:MAG: MASE3 domain-containing protein [Calditrichaceae bacterium]
MTKKNSDYSRYQHQVDSMEKYHHQKKLIPSPNIALNILLAITVLSILTVIGQYNYLLFHSTVEIFSVIMASAIFMLAWNSRRFLENNFLIILGFAYLFIGLIDILHLLTYNGMGVFPGNDTNLPTQLWIGARYFESICLIMAPTFMDRNLNHKFLLAGFTIISIALVFSIFSGGLFPDCYIDGSGLTIFKITSEYIISIFLLISGIIIITLRKKFDRDVYILVLISIILSILAELFFTLYFNVNDTSNLIGHLLKVLSFFLFYKAIIETGFKRPFTLLFRNLSTSQKNLTEINTQLNKEISERIKAEKEKEDLIAELQKSISEIKTLRGILPICSYCKKIRDDEGYWNQVEVYVKQHSDARFSHGICPDCMEAHYPEYIMRDEK